MSTRAVTQCAQCGQSDDHPKVHLADASGAAVTKHHDCLAVAEKTMVVESSDVAAGIIEVCEKGKRGDDLLAHIEKIHAKAGK